MAGDVVPRRWDGGKRCGVKDGKEMTQRSKVTAERGVQPRRAEGIRIDPRCDPGVGWHDWFGELIGPVVVSARR